jgi:hypothetical protein
MLKTCFSPTASTIAALLIFCSTNLAAADAADKRDFSSLTCKNVMRMSGTDRDIAIAFAHGYVLGQKQTTQYEVETLAGITDQFIDYCLDHPADNALQSFEKFAK